MVKSQINFPLQSAMQELTLEVNFTGIASFKVRACIATRLIKLAVMILGCKVEIK